jgi:putative transposase
VFSLSVGTVLDAAISPYKGKGTGETAMLRGLADLFSPEDILMGDRYYSGYWDIAFWLERGVDLVSIISVSRKVDFHKGQRLGKEDHIVQWKKTARPEWIDKETARNVPATISIREARITIETPGFRVKHLLVVTTLTDAELYSKEELGNLYCQRWQAELQLRSLKTHMGMEKLRCKTPAMVRKEFASYLLAYNCIRRLRLEAARSSGLQPREISFKHTLQSLNEFFPRLSPSCNLDHWLSSLLTTVSEVQVANRPGRREPYTCKLRPKDFPRPKETRSKFKSRKRQTS